MVAKKQVSIFPDLPRDQKMVDNEGKIMPLWHLYFQQLTNALQNNYQREGVKHPSQTSADIGEIETQANIKGTGHQIGNIVYDSTTNKFKGFTYASGSDPGEIQITTVEFTTTP